MFRFPLLRWGLMLLLAFFTVSAFGQRRSRYISATTKQLVFARDRGVCRCCGSTTLLEYDHITPYSCGGTSQPINIQLLCRTCNRSKSNSCLCKVHNRIVGTNCCDGNAPPKPRRGRTRIPISTDGIGAVIIPARSEASATQCTGITKKGARCRNRTTNISGRCHLH